MTERRVAVIGGGAAGMMSAVFAARSGDAVTVFEKNTIIGKKLRITGKGRCNVTNACSVQEVIANTPTNGRFLFSALNRFSPDDTIAFFEENGLALKTERGKRVFPESDRADDVAEALLRAVRREGCRIVFDKVSDVREENGHITGIVSNGSFLGFDKVIIACGGCSYPGTGSTGDGYRFAEKLGHTISPIHPSLVPLETVERVDPAADRLLLKNVSVRIINRSSSDRVIYTDFGELQLMKYGLTGAVILSASAHLSHISPSRYSILIDLKPALSEEKLDSRLLREIEAFKGKNISSMMHTLLPGVFVPMFINRTGVSPEKNCSTITKTERKNIITLLKAFPFSIKGTRPVSEAIITSGGVSVKEIDPRTMESRIIKGLHFAGEVIDVDAYTGGFNLQIAFSTGVLAGEG